MRDYWHRRFPVTLFLVYICACWWKQKEKKAAEEEEEEEVKKEDILM